MFIVNRQNSIMHANCSTNPPNQIKSLEPPWFPAIVLPETSPSLDTVMYNAMITGFSHSNDGYSAINLFCKMKHEGFKPDNFTYALLSGCRVHGNMELGIIAAHKLFNHIPEHDGTYMLLSNMYAATGQWERVARVRKLMRDRGVKKELACSWIEVETQVHTFLVDDTSHPEAEAVYNYLQVLGKEVRRLGYVFVLHDVESDGHKEDMLTTHSEKMAVAFGLMKLPTTN